MLRCAPRPPPAVHDDVLSGDWLARSLGKYAAEAGSLRQGVQKP
eukprot:COSAG01_NODE_60_length_29981_cov_23.262533_30_plen_44_part_00